MRTPRPFIFSRIRFYRDETQTQVYVYTHTAHARVFDTRGWNEICLSSEWKWLVLTDCACGRSPGVKNVVGETKVRSGRSEAPRLRRFPLVARALPFFCAATPAATIYSRISWCMENICELVCSFRKFWPFAYLRVHYFCGAFFFETRELEGTC